MNHQYIVTAVDTTGIQPYIFGSNRLRENVGASELVRLATGQWALEAVMKVAGQHHNVKDARHGEFNDAFKIETEERAEAAEVIYAGGGNIVIIFRAADSAKKFAYQLTRRALDDAPGLSLVVAHSHFLWDHEQQTGDRACGRVVDELIGLKLAAQRAGRLPSSPLLGLGVTAACESTGLVATQTNEGRYHDVRLKLRGREPTRLISRETRAKLVASDEANQWLRSEAMFAPELSGWFDFPSDIDDLGRLKGEESYVAVMHADGNNIGQRIQAISNQFPEPKDNRPYIDAMRRFSQGLNMARVEALRFTVRRLTRSLRYAQETQQELVASVLPIKYDENRKRYLLPFRPLVSGGDDVTFLCNGQLGVTLAAIYLEAFERATIEHLGEELRACAGVAIVKMHYPFARAYQLSEELVLKAKRFGKLRKASALDWHFATGGLSGSLEQIRYREYTVGERSLEKSLLLRPLLLHAKGDELESRVWLDRVEKLTLTFKDDQEWAQKRNKVKALREALREGGARVKQFCLSYGIKSLPALVAGQEDEYRQTGWQGNRCVYFDAIELMDHYVSLEER
ncbi:MAG TPA: hypothetical protein VJ810_25210 [Blastocatellia bacterium]|nr:hypothetical protein [Blastocatellia bacterium]